MYNLMTMKFEFRYFLMSFYPQDDHRLFDFNVDDRVKDFIKAVQDQVWVYSIMRKYLSASVKTL